MPIEGATAEMAPVVEGLAPALAPAGTPVPVDMELLQVLYAQSALAQHHRQAPARCALKFNRGNASRRRDVLRAARAARKRRPPTLTTA
jgi:hypothetical protein